MGEEEQVDGRVLMAIEKEKKKASNI